MNSCSLILYGLIDLFFEFFGYIMATSGGLIDGPQAEIIAYGSMALDVIKVLAVIAGFICSCIASGGLNEQSKAQMESAVNICQWIILTPAVLMAVFIEAAMINAPQHTYDLRIIGIIIFFIYATLKFVTFYGFCEFLKNFIKDAPKADFYGQQFRYVPLSMHPGPMEQPQQQTQYISGYPTIGNI